MNWEKGSEKAGVPSELNIYLSGDRVANHDGFKRMGRKSITVY
jgi:hypothetical protein